MATNKDALAELAHVAQRAKKELQAQLQFGEAWGELMEEGHRPGRTIEEQISKLEGELAVIRARQAARAGTPVSSTMTSTARRQFHDMRKPAAPSEGEAITNGVNALETFRATDNPTLEWRRLQKSRREQGL